VPPVPSRWGPGKHALDIVSSNGDKARNRDGVFHTRKEKQDVQR